MDIIYTLRMFRHELDVYGTLNDPLFLAVDVARMIDYSVGRTNEMISRVYPEDKILINVTGPRNNMGPTHGNSVIGGAHNTQKWFLTERGLYDVLMHSYKPIAREFNNAVKDILRDLRTKKQDFSMLEEWLNYPDDLSDEWENMNVRRQSDGKDEITWNDFLRSKGWTDDMLTEN